MSPLLSLLLLAACNGCTPAPTVVVEVPEVPTPVEPTPIEPTPAPGEVDPAEWASHRGLLQAALSPYSLPGEAPQIDDGTVSITDPGGNPDGSILVDAGASTTEAFIVSDFPGFREAASSTVMQTSTTVPTYSTDYDPHVGAGNCTPTTSACVAMDAYSYGAVPSNLPTSIPSGTQVYEYEVYNRIVTSCNGTPSTTSVLRGWMYRERVVVGGQEQWNQHWFLHNANAAAAYAFPTLCDSGSGTRIDLVFEKTEILDSSGNPRTTPRSLKTAADELKAACTGAQTGCNICPGTTCDYALLELDWKEYQ